MPIRTERGYTAPDGSTNTYTYDTLNRMTGLANSWAGSFGFTYDALNRRTRMTQPNGSRQTTATTSCHTCFRCLTNYPGILYCAVYTVDSAGNRTSKADQLAGVTSNYG